MYEHNIILQKECFYTIILIDSFRKYLLYGSNIKINDTFGCVF